MKRMAVLGMLGITLFLAGCGTLYIEGASSFTGPVFNKRLTEKPAATLLWLAGKTVVGVRGGNQSCDPNVVGHTLETWLGNRGAQPVVRDRKGAADYDYEVVFYSDRNYSGYQGRVEYTRVRLRIVDRAGVVKATSKGESSAWGYRSEVDEDELCEDAASGAVKSLQ